MSGTAGRGTWRRLREHIEWQRHRLAMYLDSAAVEAEVVRLVMEHGDVAENVLQYEVGEVLFRSDELFLERRHQRWPGDPAAAAAAGVDFDSDHDEQYARDAADYAEIVRRWRGAPGDGPDRSAVFAENDRLFAAVLFRRMLATGAIARSLAVLRRVSTMRGHIELLERTRADLEQKIADLLAGQPAARR